MPREGPSPAATAAPSPGAPDTSPTARAGAEPEPACRDCSGFRVVVCDRCHGSGGAWCDACRGGLAACGVCAGEPAPRPTEAGLARFLRGLSSDDFPQHQGAFAALAEDPDILAAWEAGLLTKVSRLARERVTVPLDRHDPGHGEGPHDDH